MTTLKEEYLPNYTYEEYREWEGDWELIGGVAYAMAPSPNFTHQEINLNIGIALKRSLKKCKKCKVVLDFDWKVNKETVVRPDALLVCHLGHKGTYLDKKPNIIFEILSPSMKRKDRGLKYNIYQESGVEYYILVEPVGMFAEVYKLTRGKYHLEGEFQDEAYRFDLEDCHIEFSFREIFDI